MSSCLAQPDFCALVCPRPVVQQHSSSGKAVLPPWQSAHHQHAPILRPGHARRREGETARLEVRLQQGQAADYLNFVVKESSSNRWYDSHGSNFHVPLRLALSSMAEVTIDEEVRSGVASPLSVIGWVS